MRDIATSLDFKPAFLPKAAVADNTAFVSNILDTAGYNSAVLAIVTGVEADADATFTALIEESDNSDMSGANAVSDQDLIGTEALASFDYSHDGVCRKIGYVGNKRYVRATVTPENNTGNAFVAGMWVLGGARYLPTSNPPV